MSERPRVDAEPGGNAKTLDGSDGPETDDDPGADDGRGTTDDREGEIDPAAGARGALYGLLARAFGHPDDRLHEAFSKGEFAATVAQLCERSGLDVAIGPEGALAAEELVTNDDRGTLAARYNDLFEIGYAEYTDRTDGSLEASAPPVPLYESAYREDVSWNDVNLDLARAYDYFDLAIDGDDRQHHDFLRLELEFAGYLARREAAIDADAGRARLDFLNRHLRVLANGVRDRLAGEPGTDVYGSLGVLLDAVVTADRTDLAARFDERSERPSDGGTDGDGHEGSEGEGGGST